MPISMTTWIFSISFRMVVPFKHTHLNRLFYPEINTAVLQLLLLFGSEARGENSLPTPAELRGV